MSKVTIWHNPRCSKSREALTIADQVNCETEIVKYLDTKPTVKEIEAVLKMLAISPRELMRTTEDVYKELDLKNVEDDALLIKAMAENLKLIQRPILIKNNKAIIGRPSSIIEGFLAN